MRFIGNILIFFAFLLTLMGNSARIGVCPYDNSLFIGECIVEKEAGAASASTPSTLACPCGHTYGTAGKDTAPPALCPSCHGCHNILLQTDDTYEFTSFIAAFAPAVPFVYCEHVELAVIGMRSEAPAAAIPWPPPDDPIWSARPYSGHTVPMLA